jgi:hypothetical protein
MLTKDGLLNQHACSKFASFNLGMIPKPFSKGLKLGLGISFEDFFNRCCFNPGHNIYLQNKMAASASINSVIDKATGEFKRPDAQFRRFISSQPDSEFPPEKGRYHLYVSYACPWG